MRTRGRNWSGLIVIVAMTLAVSAVAVVDAPSAHATTLAGILCGGITVEAWSGQLSSVHGPTVSPVFDST